jgi:hypothetical protein
MNIPNILLLCTEPHPIAPYPGLVVPLTTKLGAPDVIVYDITDHSLKSVLEMLDCIGEMCEDAAANADVPTPVVYIWPHGPGGEVWRERYIAEYQLEHRMFRWELVFCYGIDSVFGIIKDQMFAPHVNPASASGTCTGSGSGWSMPRI